MALVSTVGLVAITSALPWPRTLEKYLNLSSPGASVQGWHSSIYVFLYIFSLGPPESTL